MKPLVSDTPPDIEERIIEGYRKMDPMEKLGRVFSLNRALLDLATARIKAIHGEELEDRELRLRLASLWLDRESMMKVFNWDPEAKGY